MLDLDINIDLCSCGKVLEIESATWGHDGGSPEESNFGNCDICSKKVCLDCLENQDYMCIEHQEDFKNGDL